MIKVKIIRTSDYDDKTLEQSHANNINIFLKYIRKSLNEVNVTTKLTKTDIRNGYLYNLDTVIIYEIEEKVTRMVVKELV